jgi:hypothetical protein
MSSFDHTEDMFGGSDLLGGYEGGALSSMLSLSEGGKMNWMSVVSLLLSVAAILVLVALLLPWLAPDTAADLTKRNDMLGDYARWMASREPKSLMLLLAAYVAWHEACCWSKRA